MEKKKLRNMIYMQVIYRWYPVKKVPVIYSFYLSFANISIISWFI